jgi:very-short-patch-repair endonuclease/predicted Zn-ribbon and HTH transcriptional regulator
MIKNTDDFIKKAKELNNDKYDYSLVKYIKSSVKVEIKCKKCLFIFWQTPNNHITKSHQCPNCNGKLKFTKDRILEKFILKWGDRYDYSQFNEYENRLQCIKIKCKKCYNTFNQTINDHFKSGCSNCAGNKKLTDQLLLERFKNKWGNLYQYDISNFKNVKSEIRARCKKHGYFSVKIRHHLIGSGCQKCKLSKGELYIHNILKEMCVEFEQQKKFKSCKNIRQLSFDFYLPDYNTIIEYDGIQHYEPVSRFGGNKSYNRVLINDSIKNNWCKENGINLIRIRHNEDIKDKLTDLLKSYIYQSHMVKKVMSRE